MHKSSTPDHRDSGANYLDNVLDSSDILKAFSTSWHLIIILTIICAFIGLGSSLAMNQQWEAIATLHIGRIPSEATEPKLIEDPAQTVERINQFGFKHLVLANLGLPIEENRDIRSDLILNSLKAHVVQNTDFVNVSIRGYSALEAAKNMTIVVKEIQKAHALIEKPLKDSAQNKLLMITANLNQTTQEISSLNEKVKETNKPNVSFEASIVSIDLLAAKEKDKFSLQDQELQSKARIIAFDEQSTKLLNSVYVSEKSIFPKKSIFTIAGAIFGLLLGFVISIFQYKKSLE